MNAPVFEPFPKMARLSREIIVTEKIDGTNAQLLITEGGELYTGSRNRWITPDDDNFGFSRWANENKDELMKLGPGRHFGEWWGRGIQRGYGMDRKVFSLFNTSRWNPDTLPKCCDVVPQIYRGEFSEDKIMESMGHLMINGSFASRHYGVEFKDPEGIIVYHVAAGIGFKKTIKNDDIPKGKVK